MKLTGLQIFWIIITFSVGNMMLLTVQPAIATAKHDVWISYLLATIGGVLLVFIANKVALLYPKNTFIQYSKIILGKGFGTIIIFIFFIQWYSVIADILCELADFVNTILLPTTPPWILHVTMLLLLMYVCYLGGIEGIARCSEVFGPIIVISIIGLLLVSIPNMQFDRVLPIYTETGMIPILKGTLYPLTFLGECVVMLMLISFMDKPEKGTSRSLWGVALTGLFLTIIATSVIFVFGAQIAMKLRFPAFDIIRYINVMNFIQNLEIVAVLIWALSAFVKLSVYFFLASYGTAQLFKVKDWRKMIWFVAAVSLIMAIVFTNLSIYGYKNLRAYWIPIVLPVNIVGIPLLLWVVGSIRKKLGKQRQGQTNSQ